MNLSNSLIRVSTFFNVIHIAYNQTDSNETDSSYLSCDYVNYQAQFIPNLIDFLNRELIPGVLMICFSAMMVSAIFEL